MTHVYYPSALGLMDNAQNTAMIRIIRKCEKYLTLPKQVGQAKLPTHRRRWARGKECDGNPRHLKPTAWL